jgi:predicted nucleic-acid-binding protein
MRIAVDTNVLVRYLTWDDEAEAVAAEAVIERAEEIVASTIVLCELVWVLRRAYRYGRGEIADALRTVIEGRNVECDRPAVEAGLAMLESGGDFADGVVLHEAVRNRCRRIATFDRDFAGRLGTMAIVPHTG